MNWVVGIAILVIVGFILDREIYFYEGVHLGSRVQAWLYDRWSRKYDAGKRASQLRDDEMLAQPLLDALNASRIPEPFVLDFATGTGRLSYALTSRPEFKGHIIALDLSQGMLEQATVKLKGRVDPAPANVGVEFLRHVSLPLPFTDAAFDVVCALEVLELFPSMDEPLAEFARVLRPGGLLLTSRGTEASGRKAKVKSVLEYTELLGRNGFEDVQITTWWKLFDRVLAVKQGRSIPVGARKLSDVMRCGTCGQAQWKQEAGVLSCQNCGKELSITKDGIVLG
jgi:ubiquinone/menaquinone biosynthesis C-methylase UbiE